MLSSRVIDVATGLGDEAGAAKRAMQVLVCSARTEMDPVSRGRLGELLRAGVEWPVLRRLARRHGVMPLVCLHLQEVAGSDLPAGAGPAELRTLLEMTARRNLLLTGELLRLLRLFEEAGIAAIPWKGPVLAVSAYGNLALREFGDLDVLVDRADMGAASEALGHLGYRRPERVSVEQERYFLHAMSELEYVRGDLWVDLHWRFAQPRFGFGLTVHEARRRAVYAIIAGTSVRTLAPEEQLLSLCFHGAKHRWACLKWVCDVSELLRRGPELDWEQLGGTAHELGVARVVALGLRLARDLLGATLPAGAAGLDLDAPAVTSLATEAIAGLLDSPGESDEIVGLTRFVARSRERWRDRVPLYAMAITSPTEKDWRLVRLPSWLHPLYYAVHVARVAVDYGRPLLRRLALHRT